MLGWLSGADDGQRAYDLTFAYMNGWGALYPPLVAEGQWWRLFTSQLLHWGMAHLAGNLVVLVALGVPLERRFGWWRVALAWMLAVLGGDLLSLYAENPCDQVRVLKWGRGAGLSLSSRGVRAPHLALAVRVVLA